jgi:hypothetical protein
MFMEFPTPARGLTKEEEEGQRNLPASVLVRKGWNGPVKAYLVKPKDTDRISEFFQRSATEVMLSPCDEHRIEDVLERYGNEITIENFKSMAGSMGMQDLGPEGCETHIDYEIYRVKQL